MAKNRQKRKLQMRDWVIIGLFILVIGTNWIWYQAHQAQEISHRSAVESWLLHSVQINKLKACVDEGVKPCDISP